MNASEKLLNLVIEGEPNLPLPGDPLNEAFDELLKYGLIAVEDEIMILTKRRGGQTGGNLEGHRSA